jgi:hypothetical protein
MNIRGINGLEKRGGSKDERRKNRDVADSRFSCEVGIL